MKPMMNGNGLLECAHCGSMDIGIETDDDGWRYIECGECEIRTAEYRNDELMRRRWNTRNGHFYTADDYKQDAMERKHGL